MAALLYALHPHPLHGWAATRVGQLISLPATLTASAVRAALCGAGYDVEGCIIDVQPALGSVWVLDTETGWPFYLLTFK